MSSPAATPPRTPGLLQWVGAVIAITYGFAKLNGSQFTVLDSELARPMGDVQGFWLTWYWLGWSAAYGGLIAATQVLGGVLLVLPRFSLAGALLLLPVVVNILFIDFAYGIDTGGLFAAGVFALCVLATIAPHARRLLDTVVPTSGMRTGVGRGAAIAAVLVGAWALTWWIANRNNRMPTPIDGTWAVTSDSTGDARVFFERNRARMVVFRNPGVPDARHDFELDSTGTIRIWQTWPKRDTLIMQGLHTGEDAIILVREGTTDTLALIRLAPPGR
ncbi:MAG: hypothetical protein R3B35_00205 [Gemmatimonadales bacterium]